MSFFFFYEISSWMNRSLHLGAFLLLYDTANFLPEPCAWEGGMIKANVCELCWFCRVKARNNEREAGLATERSASRLFLLYYNSVEEL